MKRLCGDDKLDADRDGRGVLPDFVDAGGEPRAVARRVIEFIFNARRTLE